MTFVQRLTRSDDFIATVTSWYWNSLRALRRSSFRPEEPGASRVEQNKLYLACTGLSDQNRSQSMR
jgi:hypothetical protein